MKRAADSDPALFLKSIAQTVQEDAVSSHGDSSPCLIKAAFRSPINHDPGIRSRKKRPPIVIDTFKIGGLSRFTDK